MIKLYRTKSPDFLTNEKVISLTNEFKNSGKSVWNHVHIKTSLLSSSNGKCAYCECSLEKESNYMEVEHFEDKKNYPDKVVLWENLLPSCKKCNGAKSTHDVLSDPIVNPYVEDPREHIALRLYRLRGITQKGTATIEVVDLNNSDRQVFSRFRIGEKVSELIDISCERFCIYTNKKDIKSRNRLLVVVQALLAECQPKSDYAACTATIVLTDTRFLELIKCMKEEFIWNDQLEESLKYSLPIVLNCA